MSDLFSSWRTALAQSSGESYVSQISVNEVVSLSDSSSSPSYNEVVELISQSMSSLKVYVLESDITESQNTVKSIVSQSTF